MHGRLVSGKLLPVQGRRVKKIVEKTLKRRTTRGFIRLNA
jgi:hypothetical protein